MLDARARIEQTPAAGLLPPAEGAARSETPASLVAATRRLADVIHNVLSEHNLEALLHQIAETLEDLVPHDSLIIFELRAHDELVPVLARDSMYVDEIMTLRTRVGIGITGWAVEHGEPVLTNRSDLDPRVSIVPGTPADPDALISAPLIARGEALGALNVYRHGIESHFTEEEFELVRWFADAAALALDNARIRHSLEHQVRTDSLTGLYNHRAFHERLRAELNRASRSRDVVSLLMLDLDDFKRVNDVHGHGVGDQVLIEVAQLLQGLVRSSDVVCRLGGEEFAVILPSCDTEAALGLASRIVDELAAHEFEAVGPMGVSIGVAEGPEHAMNPRELAACAEAAMMTAKARGKRRAVVFDESGLERPDVASDRDARSLAHMKLLQTLSGKLTRLDEITQIGETIVSELRSLVDYHTCRVYVVEGEDVRPVAVAGVLTSGEELTLEMARTRVGEGVAGTVAKTGKPLLIGNHEQFAGPRKLLPGTVEVDESHVAVPLLRGSQVLGVIALSKLGLDQFDEDDLRLMEVLAGQAAVAFENALLYQAQRREAEYATKLLEFADSLGTASSPEEVGKRIVSGVARLLGCGGSLWLRDDGSGDYVCVEFQLAPEDDPEEDVTGQCVPAEIAEELLAEHDGIFTLLPEERIPGTPRFTRPIALVPLHGDLVAGWISLRLPEGGLDPAHTRLLDDLSYHASTALQKALLAQRQAESAEIASSLLEFSQQLIQAESLDQVFARALELTSRLLGSPRAALWLQDRRSGDFVCRACHGYDHAGARELQRRRYHLPAPELTEGRPTRIAMRRDEVLPVQPSGEGAEDEFVVSVMRFDDGTSGWLVAAVPDGTEGFSETKLALLDGIAHQTQLAIANAAAYDDLERTFLSTVEALAGALEANDEYTSSHTRAICDMALRVGERLGLDAAALKRLELGALFHDIGKIGIPERILAKPAPLSGEEWELMRTHTEIGARILAPIERLESVCPIVRHAHEHFDGSGYPDGLAGEEIPLESRIILVVDAYHAMTTDRPYRARLPREEACRRLREAAGTQFDPRVVDTFLALVA